MFDFDPEIISLAPLWYVAFLLSLTCHEAAHALAAQLGGDDTAARGGQVTLNPLPHIQREPTGTILVPILSLLLAGWMLGWASAPYDPYWQQRYPRRAAWMALAGPGANLVLAILTGFVILWGVGAGYFAPPEYVSFTGLVVPVGEGTVEGIAAFLSILFAQNILLMAFNLMPVPPLDGATAIGVVLPEELMLKWLDFINQPGFSMVGLLAAWYLFGEIFMPIFVTAVRTLYWPVL